MVSAVVLDLLVATGLVCLWEPRLLIVFGLTVLGHRYIRRAMEKGRPGLGIGFTETLELERLEEKDLRIREEAASLLPLVVAAIFAILGTLAWAWQTPEPQQVAGEPAVIVTQPAQPGGSFEIRGAPKK